MTTTLTVTIVREKDLQDAVNHCARYLGWSVYHTYDSRRSVPGFPDIIAIRPPRLIVAELKTEAGQLTIFQEDWLARFQEIPGIDVYVWRPSDWLSGAVEEVLR